MKDKLINFLLVFLIVFFVLSMFDGSKKTTQTNWNLIIKSASDSYNVPASVKIDLQNNTAKEISLNTCDLKIKSSAGIVDLADKAFCRDIKVAANKTQILDYSKYFSKFEITWDYFIEAKIEWKDYMSQFSIGNMGFFAKFFTFFFYAPFYNLIAFIVTMVNYSLFWAIIIVTVIIRSILLYPQHKMMVSQAKMQTVQPKIKEIQEKHKWDHQTLWVELMKLYKEEKVNPMGSCLPLLIQMPILIVVYHILTSIQDPVNTYYLYSFMQNFSVLAIQTKFYFIDLISVWGWVGWILAIAVRAVQFTQIKLSMIFNKAPENKTWVVLEKKQGDNDYSSFMPDQAVMNKFMLYGMPVMVGIFTFTFYIWVGIYWWISTTFMIFQQIVVNKIIKKSI